MPPADCYPEKAKAVDEVMDALSHHLRRETLHYFENAIDEEAATVGEIADHIDARMPDRDREELPAALVHNHLPKLESAGWLEFDQRSGEVRYHGHESASQWLRDVHDIFAE